MIETADLVNETREPTLKATAEQTVGRIIVVDDEFGLKNALVDALTAQSFEVRGFTNGHEALKALSTESFDLLISDLMMPEMDGITLIKAALEMDPHLIAIMMTGQGTIQTAVDAMRFGAFDYVLKPFRLKTLMPVLTRAINTRRLRMENLQLRETVAIYSLCQTIAFTLDSQTLLSKLADAALQQSDADEVSILLPTDDGKELFVAAVRGEARERLLGERIPLEQSIASWVARERLPLILNGEVDDERFVALWPRADIRSAVSVPMQVANKLVGIINLNMTNRIRPFTLGQMKALTILASTAAVALESASLYTQVRAAEKKYRSIFENAIEGLFQSTFDGRLLTANPALARLLGYDTPEELIAAGKDLTPQLYVNSDDRKAVARPQEKTGVLVGFETEVYRKDGTKIWVSVNRRFVRDQTGEPIYLEGSIENITERKLTEEELRKSEERYRDLVENAHDPIYEHDLEGNYTASNKAGERLTGYTLEESLKLNVIDTVAPEYREKAKGMIERKLAGESVTAYELEVIAKNGTRIPVEVNTHLVLRDGLPVGVQGIARDITERKRAEVSLRESEERYRLLFQSNPQPMWVYDLDTLAFLAVNDAAVRHYGYSRDEFLAMTIADIRPPQDLPALRDSVAKSSQGLDETGVWRHIKKDGNIIEVEVTSHLLQFEERRAELILAHDITERRKAENRLAAQYAVVRALAESNSLDEAASRILQAVCESLGWAYGSLWVVDLASNVLRCSQVWHEPVAAADEFESISRPRDFPPGVGLPGKVWAEREPVWMADVSEHADFQRLAGANRAGFHSGFGFPIRFRSDVVGVVEFFSYSVREHDQELLAMMSTIGSQIGQFIERKRVEEALHNSEEQLRQSQKLEAVGQLAGGVAHDFNNLLTVIGGYSSILLSKLPKDSPHLSNIEEIKKASDRASALTRQLLAFSRKQILQPKVLDLNIVVADLEKMLRRLIGEDIDLLAVLSPVLGKVKADPGQIEQVLLNLIVNARDAMPQGGKLTIETKNVLHSEDYARRQGTQPGAYVMLAVTDSGSGMDSATQARIFDPFFTTKSAGKGTGLGLATVYGIVKQSGGNIWVYSEVGRGTTFKIFLPRVDEIIPSRESGELQFTPRGTETVLLVEDEEQVRAILTHILEGQGYQVLSASDGEAALSISRDLNLDIRLMITDVVMPQMSGRELAEHVLRVRPNLPILFMSGYTDDAIVRHGLLDEKLNFIQKPFDSTDVARKVREVLDSKRA